MARPRVGYDRLMFAVLGGAPKVVPGLLSPMYLPEGQTKFPDYGALQRQGLPLAPYIEHGSYETGQPSIFRYGRDPYRGIMGQVPTPGPAPAIAQLEVSERAQQLAPMYAPVVSVYRVLRPLSAAAMAFHGYRRHRGKLLWALGWALMGGAFPLIAPAIALAQGYGQPMKERR